MKKTLARTIFVLNFVCMANPLLAMDSEPGAGKSDSIVVAQLDKAKDDSVDSQGQAANEKISFFDSRIFDAKLGKELEQGKDSVEIDVSGKVLLNNIPSRIDRWISKSAEEGKVEIKQHVASRSWFSLVPLVFNAFGIMKNYQEEKALNFAKNYDTVIFYRNDERGEAVINKIVMTRRK
jgi:hypothetical protein